jgi:hypothetical protein
LCYVRVIIELGREEYSQVEFIKSNISFCSFLKQLATYFDLLMFFVYASCIRYLLEKQPTFSRDFQIHNWIHKCGVL